MKAIKTATPAGTPKAPDSVARGSQVGDQPGLYNEILPNTQNLYSSEHMI